MEDTEQNLNAFQTLIFYSHIRQLNVENLELWKKSNLGPVRIFIWFHTKWVLLEFGVFCHTRGTWKFPDQGSKPDPQPLGHQELVTRTLFRRQTLAVKVGQNSLQQLVHHTQVNQAPVPSKRWPGGRRFRRLKCSPIPPSSLPAPAHLSWIALWIFPTWFHSPAPLGRRLSSIQFKNPGHLRFLHPKQKHLENLIPKWLPPVTLTFENRFSFVIENVPGV